MPLDHGAIEELRVPEGGPAGLRDRPTRADLGLDDKDEGRALLDELAADLFEWQRRLWAEDRRALLLVLQGMDTAGKDGTIRHVMGAFHPQGCDVVGFKVPTPEELA
ncbi:MAG TPA: hypothetical protein VGA69_12200, partial [Nitriliruptorales bacterium]